MENELREYYAFISYKREDEKWAKWLQQKLEHYRFPTNLNGHTDLPKNIRPTFRDVTDLKPGLLAEEIDNALRNSQWLIVVCSPRSAKSPWVCKEAQTFIDLGRVDHIIPFVIEGRPFSGDIATECYPEALLNLTGGSELLAANINEMGSEAAVIKVVARMFGLRFDTLWQRHEREKRRRRNWIVALVSLFVLAVMAIAGYILLLNRNLTHTNNARAIAQSRAVAEAAISFYDMGDGHMARRLACEALELAYSPEAERALRMSYYFEGMVFRGHSDEVNAVAISPDNSLVVSGSNDRTFRVWDMNDGNCLMLIDTVQESVYSVGFNSDGTRFLTAVGNDVYVWDTKTRQCLMHLKGQARIARSAVFSPDGKRVASGFFDDTIRIWDLETEQCVMKLSVPGAVCTVAYSPDGNRLASGSSDSTVRIWDVRTGQCLASQKKHYEWVRNVSFSPDGKTLASSALDTVIQIYDAFTGEMLSTIESPQHLYSLAFSADGSAIVGGAWKQIDFWSSRSGTLLFSLEGHTNTVNSVVCSADQRYLVSGSSDKTVRVWSIMDEQEGKAFVADSPTNTIEFSPKGYWLVATGDSTVSVFSSMAIYTEEAEKVLISRKFKEGKVKAISCSSNERVVAVASGDYVFLWDYISDRMVKKISSWSKDVIDVAFSPDGSLLTSVYFDGMMYLWDVETGDSLRTMNHESSIRCVCFSPDGKYIVTGSWDGTLCLWDVHSGELIVTNNTSLQPINSVSFCPDGSCFCTASWDQTVRIWDAKTLQELRVLESHIDYVKNACFSPDGTKIVSASQSGKNSVCVWDVASGKLLKSYDGCYAGGAFFSPDGKAIVMETGAIKVYPFPPIEYLVTKTRERYKNNPLTQEERIKYYLE